MNEDRQLSFTLSDRGILLDKKLYTEWIHKYRGAGCHPHSAEKEQASHESPPNILPLHRRAED